MIATSTVKSALTLEEFLALPEAKPYAEYIDGNIEPKPVPQGEHSVLQIRLGTTINQVALPQKLAHAFTELRCNINGRSLVPDISVFRWERIPKTETGRIANRVDTYPDWVIEILSPDQSANKVIKKIMVCLQAGTQLAWLIDPKDESVLILKPQQFPELKSDKDALPILDSLSMLELSAQVIFSWLSLD
ncbi:Uma2 family endonuclease [Phormidium sp. FACHB-1136]|uniref:Uma2 family endonuclease n=1 Tax=Phormidium sp. FACHB-1136 TaxID=2692848 RepID=UPI001683C98B|nr:Uma2 family endonuclease [Phormidium sp. FACHB-1136]